MLIEILVRGNRDPFLFHSAEQATTYLGTTDIEWIAVNGETVYQRRGI